MSIRGVKRQDRSDRPQEVLPYVRSDGFVGETLSIDSFLARSSPRRTKGILCRCVNQTSVEQRINILTIGGNQFAQVHRFIEQNARDFENQRGGKVAIEVTAVESMTTLFDEIRADAALTTSFFDGYVTNPLITGSAVALGGWKDLGSYVTESSQLDWTDILLTYREKVNVYDKSIYMIPLDGDTISMFYRTDILEHFQLEPPRTWDEYNVVAETVHGKVYNGTRLIGSCIGRELACTGFHWANLVLSSITQYDGTSTGFLFDSSDMSPLMGEALAEALRHLEGQVKYGAPDEFSRCGGGGYTSGNIYHMNEGRCVLTYNWGDSFKIHLSEGSVIGGLLGVAKTPGSTKVFDRISKKLVPCTEDLCKKYGEFVEGIGWINHAPYAARGGWTAAVSNKTSTQNSLLAADFFAFASSTRESIKGVVPNATLPLEYINGQDPFRKSHLNLNEWVRSGYPRNSTVNYTRTVLDNLSSENVVVDIRFPEADKITMVFDKEIHDHLRLSKGGMIPENDRAAARLQVAERIANEWDQIISNYNSRPENDATILELYQRSLNIYVDPQNLNQIDVVRPIGLALSAIIIFWSVVCGLWVMWYRRTRIVKASQPIFLALICVGTILMAATIVPMSIDDGVASLEGCDIACMAAPWLLTFGFICTFAALFSKIWRIYRVTCNSKSFRRIKVTETDVLLPFLVLLILNFAFMLSWTLADPLRWERVHLDKVTSYGSCKAKGRISVVMAVLIAMVNTCALALANIYAYKARKISVEYSESKYVGMAMASIMQVWVIGIPLLFLVRTNPSVEFFVGSALIFVTCMTVLLLVFVPKHFFLRKDKRSVVRRGGRTFSRSFVSEPPMKRLSGVTSSAPRLSLSRAVFFRRGSNDPTADVMLQRSDQQIERRRRSHRGSETQFQKQFRRDSQLEMRKNIQTLLRNNSPADLTRDSQSSDEKDCQEKMKALLEDVKKQGIDVDSLLQRFDIDVDKFTLR